ncbi:salicylate synthase [Streptomyces sp. STCH 565 A]|uniref:salicylate synthase n=1 Tax=Streptomyces sp. STCH 565 A TaxID=2950532 RepID=UPI0020754F5E|nr:salicylate synthase [Streptomyces sp. STCH 565 A]MCM8554659.1 salicylate synthase [Streptomyces sp. STCH 565 A]
MARRQYPYELRMRAHIDPLVAVGRLARSTTFGKFVVYERDGTWTFAGGAAAEIVLDHNGFRTRWHDRKSLRPFPEDPARAFADILAEAPVDDWSLYGWTAFEFAYAQAGLPGLLAPGVLLHAIVPQVEIGVRADGAVLRGGDRRLLQVLADTVAEASEDVSASPVSLAVEESGGEEYRTAVASVVADIRAKRLTKAIVSRVVPVAFDIDLVATYLAGRRGNTPARSFLLNLDGLRAAGFSPETVAEVSAGGRVVSRPLAGTRALHAQDRVRSERLRADLVSDPKEVFEHAVSVRLACEEMESVCRAGTVGVEEFMRVQERGSVQHLASAAVGRLADDRGPWDVFAALFPAVTASGIPKAAAYRAIRAHETGPRGLYGGAVFTADAQGGLDSALVLRTVFQQHGRTWLQAGAGIVADSTPDREFEETCEKMRSVARYLVPAVPGTPPDANAAAASAATRHTVTS